MRPRAVLAALPSALLSLALALIAAPAVAAPAVADPAVRPGHDPETWLAPDATLTLQVDGRPAGRLAVFVGTTDVTDLFRRRGGEWTYRPELLPLPRGESELVVWDVAAGGWRELGRWPLRVRHRGGAEALELSPRVDLQGLAGVAEGGDAPGEEDRLTTQLDLQGLAARRGTQLRTAWNVVGVSQVEQALRFGEEGEDAERVDLSTWSAAVVRGRYALELGHLAIGDSRQLLQSFASRGARFRVRLGGGADFRLAAVNGSSIVGWDDFFGLERDDHRLMAGVLGMEALPSRPGALRLEATLLDGSLLPRSGFNQAEITDREESSGWSARVLAATPSQRLRLDAGWAESRYDNPFDPLLAQGADLVPVTEATAGARYADLVWTALERQAVAGRPLQLAVDLRHHRVEPLYRSVGTYLQADVRDTSSALRLLWGGTAAELSYGEARDNLDDVPSVLTTRTRRAGWTFSAPLAELLGGEQSSPWLPVVSIVGGRTHQAGDGVPVDGGFSPSHVPDQVSWNHQASVQWAGGTWSLALAGVASDQDNRQPGREDADFRHRGGGFEVFVAPRPWLDLGLDLRRDRQTSEESGEATTTDAVGVHWTLRLPARFTFAGNLSWSESATEPDVRRSRDWIGDAQLSWAFERRRRDHGVGGQLFLRGAFFDSDARDFLFGFAEARDGWHVTSGVALSLH